MPSAADATSLFESRPTAWPGSTTPKKGSYALRLLKHDSTGYGSRNVRTGSNRTPLPWSPWFIVPFCEPPPYSVAGGPLTDEHMPLPGG